MKEKNPVALVGLGHSSSSRNEGSSAIALSETGDVLTKGEASTNAMMEEIPSSPCCGFCPSLAHAVGIVIQKVCLLIWVSLVCGHWHALVMSRPSGTVKGEVQLARVVAGSIFHWAQGGDRLAPEQCYSDTMSPGGWSTLENIFRQVRLRT